MATRTLPSERDRKMTIFLTPFMSCSAKLPIYGLFTAAFFREYQIAVVFDIRKQKGAISPWSAAFGEWNGNSWANPDKVTVRSLGFIEDAEALD